MQAKLYDWGNDLSCTGRGSRISQYRRCHCAAFLQYIRMPKESLASVSCSLAAQASNTLEILTHTFSTLCLCSYHVHLCHFGNYHGQTKACIYMSSCTLTIAIGHVLSDNCSYNLTDTLSLPPLHAVLGVAAALWPASTWDRASPIKYNYT